MVYNTGLDEPFLADRRNFLPTKTVVKVVEGSELLTSLHLILLRHIIDLLVNLRSDKGILSIFK